MVFGLAVDAVKTNSIFAQTKQAPIAPSRPGVSEDARVNEVVTTTSSGEAPILVDPFGRAIRYLRVSVTDRCDFQIGRAHV